MDLNRFRGRGRPVFHGGRNRGKGRRHRDVRGSGHSPVRQAILSRAWAPQAGGAFSETTDSVEDERDSVLSLAFGSGKFSYNILIYGAKQI